jgi:hypothetical protein
MWITFSLFLTYSYVMASVQCENCFYNDKSFLAIPNMPGFYWTEEVWAPVMLQQHTTGITTATTMATAGINDPLAPHMRPCAPRCHIKWIEDNLLS